MNQEPAKPNPDEEPKGCPCQNARKMGAVMMCFTCRDPEASRKYLEWKEQQREKK